MGKNFRNYKIIGFINTGENQLMKNFSILKAGGIITILFLLVLESGCGKKPEQTTNKKIQVPVSVTQVKRESISEKKTYSGSLEGINQAVIVSKIAERIIDIKASVNQFVNKGDIVIQLDRSGATSNYLQAKANYENTQKNYERMKALYNEGAISQQQLDQTQTAYEVAKANFDAAKSTVDLESPINGIVTDLNVNIGDWVNPGTQLATIANISKMIVKFYVNESEVQKFQLGDKVNIYSDFSKERGVTGTITEISRSASSETRSFQIKAEFSNSNNSWYKPGMFVNVDVVLESQKDVLVVPTQAVIFSNSQNTLYKIENNVAIPVQVKIGLTNENITEITNRFKRR